MHSSYGEKSEAKLKNATPRPAPKARAFIKLLNFIGFPYCLNTLLLDLTDDWYNLLAKVDA
ncbi:hypothetical protein EOE67_13070 [Rheinheimera riviphila]|uniref:Uncharacterized protein n=1 Tax=Rheinheimera riviphila TaxID=1834037 RepID=A0A437QLZ2_9GAMM|nr:hypothetical protein [Rheinheimera riviphila]RVU35525.1 hypothetical protein EOE67_13070 [Rheinheimera riviphila]